MIADDAHEHAIEEENYFVSMTDMMVGLVFIFIILLMYYALQFRQVTDELTGADATRAEILTQIQSSLKRQGVEVLIDTQNGVLRLPDSILFDSGDDQLKPEGRTSVEKLAVALEEVLPCYTGRADTAARPAHCEPSEHAIESVYIEGHTDADAFSRGGRDNWDLSVVRATNTYRAIVGSRPDLGGLCAVKGDRCDPVLSVSGYGPQRPAYPGDSAEAKAKNRRIDLRIIMVTPDSGQTVRRVEEALEAS
jgi:Flagellar motor protein